MRKLFILFTAAFLFTSGFAQNQYTYEDPNWFIGSGNDTAYFVVSFPVINSYDPPSSFIYGYLFNDSVPGSTIMNDVAAADMNLDFTYSGGFLDSVSLGNYGGKNGVGANFWGSYSDTIGATRWHDNIGIASMVYPGSYFGLSYNDFNPEILPDTSVAVNNPTAFVMNDIEYFVGTGSDTACFVVDFLDGNSFAWGYLFEDSISAEVIMNDIAADDTSLSISITGFLNDITFDGIEGLAGAPNYWNTWSARNNGIWYANSGIGETVYSGDWFGCSYPNYPPAIFPTTPVARDGGLPSAIWNQEIKNIKVYPNPVQNEIHFSDKLDGDVEIYDQLGRLVAVQEVTNGRLFLKHIAHGYYVLVLKSSSAVYQSSFIKE